jgi:hypothetical protein
MHTSVIVLPRRMGASNTWFGAEPEAKHNGHMKLALAVRMRHANATSSTGRIIERNRVPQKW